MAIVDSDDETARTAARAGERAGDAVVDPVRSGARAPTEGEPGRARAGGVAASAEHEQEVPGAHAGAQPGARGRRSNTAGGE
jgi:hypothetical protein